MAMVLALAGIECGSKEQTFDTSPSVPGPLPSKGRGRFQIGALFGEADFGEAEEDEAEDGLGVLRSAQATIGAELVGSSPKAFLQRVGDGVPP